MIFELPLLCYNDLEEEIAIESDASVHGLGAVLLQGGRPVAFTSRTMMEIQIVREKLQRAMIKCVTQLEVNGNVQEHKRFTKV